jgi:hypothetical protein
MAKNAFFSFHYTPDCWRAAQVRNMGVVDGNKPCTDNDWEQVKRGGHAAIEKWIGEQLKGRSCTVVLVGTNTAGRKWITHEISESWNKHKGIVGVRIHGLRDADKSTCTAGGNPFEHVTFTKNGAKLSTVVKLYDPTDFFWDSTATYNNIKANLTGWIEEAVEIRSKHD